MAGQNRNLKLTLKDVRCFAGEQHFNIRPLTFLIGENSTGKTTVMSCFSAIYSFISQAGLHDSDFNKGPYFMGSFADIVSRSKPGKAQKSGKNFEMGISCDQPNIAYKFLFKEKTKGAEPVLDKATADCNDISFFCREKKEGLSLVSAKDKSRKEIFKQEYQVDNMSPAAPILDSYVPRKTSSPAQAVFSAFNSLIFYRRELLADEIFNMAPVRSKPQRTYNPITESPAPEGAEIPVRLRNLSAQGAVWPGIHEKLTAFGKASGLFSDIEVRQFGETKGDPFQLQFQIRGIKSNIIDAGYGLSQILPLLAHLFDSRIQRGRFSAKSGTRFLLQQPEVHLHPAAQAELASLFVQSAAKANNSFLIETHSDFILDRTRIEVRKGEIAPDQVSIIYFEPVKDRVKAHNLSLDKQGNLIGAPEGYRKFFIKETDRLLGFED